MAEGPGREAAAATRPAGAGAGRRPEADNWLYRAMAAAAQGDLTLNHAAWNMNPKTIAIWALKPPEWTPPPTTLLRLCRSRGFPALVPEVRRRLAMALLGRSLRQRKRRDEVTAFVLSILEAVPDSAFDALSLRIAEAAETLA